MEISFHYMNGMLLIKQMMNRSSLSFFCTLFRKEKKIIKKAILLIDVAR